MNKSAASSMSKRAHVYTRNDFFKTVGIVSMLVDHVGLIFFPQILIFRIVGRLALPIFAFGIANGYKHTSNLKKYFLRLLVFGLIAQVPFMLIIDSQELNVLFTLAYGLAILFLLNKKKYFIVLILILLSIKFPMDYGYYGVLAIFSFYFFKNKLALMVFFLLLTIVFSFELQSHYQLISFAGVLLVLYFPVKMFKLQLPKYFFYWFYPIHLIILFFIKYFITSNS